MDLRRTAYAVVIVALLGCACRIDGQSDSNGPQPSEPYTLRLPVDEVVLTFAATDADGLPINDLKAEDFKLRDNGVAPRRIVAFDSLVDRSIRAAVLLDTSESDERALPANRVIAERFVQHVFHEKPDAAFVAEFGYSFEITQAWTSDASLLVNGIQNAHEKNAKLPGGTALFNAVFRACFYGFNNVDPTATGNFILLFSDGEDNAGFTSMEEAARACQRSDTQIYAFLPSATQDRSSTGPKALRELTARTGGRVFLADDREDAIRNALKTIESDVRNRYRLVYKPATLRHDGAFHEIELQPPDRVSKIQVRSGYFAPRQ